MDLRAGRRRVLDQIEFALETDDPGLRRGFAFFASLTEPESEQLPHPAKRPRWRVVLLPLAAISLAGFFAASLLVSGSGYRCPAAPPAAAHAAHAAPQPGRAAHCQPRPTPGH
jgi:Protein of unknown function (DUF3040)